MADDLTYDVFLSHSSKDKAIVRPLAKRLREDGLRVWFDEWEIQPGDSVPAKIDEGLERSRILVLCMSANAFGSDWAQLESYTFRFRDPLNKDRRFIPLRLDNAPIKASLAQFLYIDWLPKDREQEYARLLLACRLSQTSLQTEAKTAGTQAAKRVIQLDCDKDIYGYAFAPDGKRALASPDDATMGLWDLETGSCLRVFKGHTNRVWSTAWSRDLSRALSASFDSTIRLWNIETGRCLRVFRGHDLFVYDVAWSPDERFALSCAFDNTVRLWDVETGRCIHVFNSLTNSTTSIAWSPDQRRVVTGSDGTLQIWDVETGRCLGAFRNGVQSIYSIVWSRDEPRILFGSHDSTLQLWDVEAGRCLRIFEGHSDAVVSVVWSPDQRFALSGSLDRTIRLWDMETGRCLRLLVGHTGPVSSITWTTNQSSALSGDNRGDIHVWDLSEFASDTNTRRTSAVQPCGPDQTQYTNAKVLLVGDSSAGKTGLSTRLALGKWKRSDSTVGAWATQWKLPVHSDDGVEREIWLWDFGGQADQRLIHQLYMDETALAVLVFDGQKEDLFETLGQWDRDLTRASGQAFGKLLVAGRVDASALRISRHQVEAFARERGYTGFLETSAKKNIGCNELKQAILDGIRWEEIPCRTTLVLFKRLKDEIVRLKDEGRVLMRFNELRDTLQLRMSGEIERFTDVQLKAVVSLLAGPGVVWELKFGSWVLLQPERINAYAQAVIQTMRKDEDERGCLPEDRVLNGDLTYHSSIVRLKGDEERFVLLAMHQVLLERGLCLREHTEKGPVLIFPSYYRRERPELVGHPAVLVSYRFSGFIDDIYATLVVKLHHTKSFDQDKLWRYAADFKTTTGKKRQLGVKLTRLAEGAGELDVYFDPTIPVEEKIIFSRYVHEHLMQNAKEVKRLRHYVCTHCGTPAGNREVAMSRLAEGKTDMLCVKCEQRFPLWDVMEELFASNQTRQRVREMQEQSEVVLDNESKERALVGDVISTVALSGQICRELNVSDHGIDMEIEFKDKNNEATGKKLYLQLKSGDSYLRQRSDGTEIFTIKDERHARYWMKQKFPVLLVIRNSEGEIRWMEVRDWLKQASNNGKKPVKSIIFEGERFDVMSVRRWLEVALPPDP